MKNALVIGGSNGLGSVLVQALQENGCQKINILDRIPPESKIPNVNYFYIDLAKYNLSIIEQFNDIDTLIITAGIGRLASFDTFNDTEIQKTFQINAVSVIRIIHHFYAKLKSDSPFYCGLLSSISGAVSSPLFALYGATKAALFRFTESINIELEKEGSVNRILNICPGVLQGTSFYGGKTDFSPLQLLAETIIEKIKKREILFIPQYDEVYRNVLERYEKDARQFGLESYAYKKISNRISSTSPITIGYLSGTFDLFHIGHLNLIKRAKEYCDYLVVGVHKNATHKNKITFIPFEERCKIVKNIKYVDKVIESKPEDSDIYEDIKYNFLFVGSDYKGSQRFERYENYFKDKNVKIIYLPYTTTTSSTKLRALIETELKE
jgi:cytidyltransferase-like protein